MSSMKCSDAEMIRFGKLLSPINDETAVAALVPILHSAVTSCRVLLLDPNSGNPNKSKHLAVSCSDESPICSNCKEQN